MQHWPWVLLVLSWATSVQCSTGAYLFDAAGCLACHTAEDGAPLAGGRPFETPYGVFYSPNISPDPETGIGRWRKQDFVRALKHGEAPDGSAYFPAFPYPSYRLMSDEDAGELFDAAISQDILLGRGRLANHARGNNPEFSMVNYITGRIYAL